jgi:Glyoxalase-like domain
VRIRVQCVVVDAHDPPAVAEFWARALGWRVTYREPDESVIEPPEGSPEVDVAPDLVFVRVPERKAVKNRLHLDLRPEDQAAEVDRLLGLGARRAAVGQTGQESWVVLADPEGNEFCVLAPLPAPAT